MKRNPRTPFLSNLQEARAFAHTSRAKALEFEALRQRLGREVLDHRNRIVPRVPILTGAARLAAWAQDRSRWRVVVKLT